MRDRPRAACRFVRGLAALLAVAMAPALSPSAFGQAGLSAEAVESQIAERFGVEVLRVEEGEVDGRPVYLVTVMNPAGDYNGAFQVTRLAVDRATGELVSQFRHGPAGYELSGGPIAGAGNGADGRAIRRMTLQESSPQ